MDGSDTKNMHDLVPTKLATAVWDILSKYKSSVPDFPQKETCELLIVDRTIDQVPGYVLVEIRFLRCLFISALDY